MADRDAVGRDLAPAVPPPAAQVSFDETYEAVAASLPVVRTALTRWLHSHAANELVIGEVVLAVTEACTNVAMHAYRTSLTGSFRVVANHIDAAVRITISDQGGGMAPRPDSPGLGLGLLLMRSCSDSLDIKPTSGAATGTAITMHFTAAGASERYAGGR